MIRTLFLALILLAPITANAQGNSADTASVRILSWNIKFLPRALAHIGHRPLKRVPFIAEKLIKNPADIIVFQEAFDGVANKRLKKLLLQHYPYWIGPANKKGAFKISSGIVIASKTPITELGSIVFDECAHEDCMAKKGALLVETEMHGKKIQVLGTHMDSRGPNSVKLTQYKQLAGLLDLHKKTGIPQFACGDFNTPKTDTALYGNMIRTVNGEDGPLSGTLQSTFDLLVNDMNPEHTDHRDVIDYILYRGNGIDPLFIRREVIRHLQQWNKKHADLSDHFAVLMTLRLP